MSPLDAVRFDAAGYVHERDEATYRVWTTPLGDALVLHHRDAPPDIEVPITNLAKLRVFYRAAIEKTGAEMIEVDRCVVEGLVAIRILLRAARDPGGDATRYVGSLSLPFRTMSYVFNLQCDARDADDDALGRVRDTLGHVERTLRLDASLRAVPRFTGLT